MLLQTSIIIIIIIIINSQSNCNCNRHIKAAAALTESRPGGVSDAANGLLAVVRDEWRAKLQQQQQQQLKLSFGPILPPPVDRSGESNRSRGSERRTSGQRVRGRLRVS